VTRIQDFDAPGIILRIDSTVSKIDLFLLNGTAQSTGSLATRVMDLKLSEVMDLIPSEVIDWNIESISAEVLRLERCINELQSWLGLGLKQICDASGISRSTVYAWRLRGSEPRPSTISSFSNFHALVKLAMAKEGIEGTREFFKSGSPSILDELMQAADDSSRAKVISNLRRRLIVAEVPPPNPFLAVMPRDPSGSTGIR
jgi:hypothetical protein